MKLIMIDGKAVAPQHVTGVVQANTWAGDQTLIYFLGGSNMIVKAEVDEVVRLVNEALARRPGGLPPRSRGGYV